MDPELDPDPELNPDPELDPDPVPLARGTDPGIRIRTKMSRIPNTACWGASRSPNVFFLSSPPLCFVDCERWRAQDEEGGAEGRQGSSLCGASRQDYQGELPEALSGGSGHPW